jgi:8-oxo-dGTP pyrophosphatase MutT (NUDIX family)
MSGKLVCRIMTLSESSGWILHCAMLMETRPDPSPVTAVDLRRQVGALVWRFDEGILKVLLVTSRDTGRFVIPKGWPMRKIADAKAAAKEAYEEAGVKGKIRTRPIGHYDYNKIFGPGFALPCRVTVYAMQGSTILSKWPEKSERKRHWMTLDDAANSVHEPELRDLIEGFVPVL